MKNRIEVLVIGTEPPCPRCDLLHRLVQETPNFDMQVTFRHCAFDSQAARAFGKKLGYKTGTAKHVAKDADIKIDWDVVYQIINGNEILAKSNSRPADKWTPELDKVLEPCQSAAESAGYLMTPILVVNGEVKHHGSVPTREQISEWLSE